MRIWSVHPSYLDSKGLVALWREGLLARKVLEGKTKGYTNHPQLLRFKKCKDPLRAIDVYLEDVSKEAKKRSYHFNTTKIRLGLKCPKIPVTDGQLMHEMKHLKSKLQVRDPKYLKNLSKGKLKDAILPHPLFKQVKGRVEQWEKITDNLKSFPYDLDFKNIDFRKHQDLYKIGIGEQGVLMVEPYKSEILPYWKFRTPEIAEQSAKKILSLFNRYKDKKDFVGMDMARKFLQMGYTRSRRYANHASGRKYEKNGEVRKQEKDWKTNDKAKSARIFYGYYLKAKEDETYKKMKEEWLKHSEFCTENLEHS